MAYLRHTPQESGSGVVAGSTVNAPGDQEDADHDQGTQAQQADRVVEMRSDGLRRDDGTITQQG
ncbi:hypothetical protein GCM10010413_39450 [Promicromonospora sukumoe]